MIGKYQVPRVIEFFSTIDQFSGLKAGEDILQWQGNSNGTFKGFYSIILVHGAIMLRILQNNRSLLTMFLGVPSVLSKFCNLRSSSHYKHEMALDAYGRRLLVTSNSLRAPIYQVRGHAYGMRTLPHSASITTVDWHPTSPIFLTGSADHSVRVTSMA
ncbi:hypothetical protein MTR67_052124 [Solanum verrucosum]|uniref:WD-repeat protein n=1 Tax=Solanum verrucosum TaxID=315347 RepID=A0AAF0V7U3_SOLVR|nr:hypothetical protein MTR67_052124 [Solanum verrucosum]